LATSKQRQSRAEAKRRSLILQALQLRNSGASYQQIGDLLGIDKSTAYRWVQQQAEDAISETAREHVALELMRLDRMLMAVWADAITGNFAAIDRALKIMEQRARLLHLYDNAPEPDLPQHEGVIVIRGETQEEYIAGLRAMRGIGELPLPPSNGNGQAGS
jgi:transposase-like protein